MRLNPLKCTFAMEAGKFLGFMITQRGVEANPEKCQAIIQMKSPGCIKDVQRLAGRLTSLSRFLGASATKALPFFNLMRKGIAFEWTPACEEAFMHFKEILAAPPVLGKPKDGEPLYLYLAITREALAAVLVREEGRAQQPIYFVSIALQGAELRQPVPHPGHDEGAGGHPASVKAGLFMARPITSFLENGKLPEDEKATAKLRREAAKYAVIQGQLFKKGLNQSLLKCLHPDQTDYVLREVHLGYCGHHIGGKALARKLIRAGYYWPSMMADSKEFVRKCVKCQENANFHRAPASELSLLTSSRPFSQWGVDLLGPFPVGPGQVKYLIVAIDYYTKWIEVEPLASISSSNCRKFMWRVIT
ncbi:uncharacterized protein [Arachis hypogaea]|uniref:uncharacterized protein n=1 Tax=Arachis hypogaea TaxID=3818 RepID=UPI003B22180F